MSKYFDDNGILHPEYMEKVSLLMKDSARKYDEEYSLMEQRHIVLTKELKAAEQAYLDAYKARDTAYGAWCANDQGFSLAQARNKAQKKISDDALRTFSALQDIEDEKDGKAQRKTELKTACIKLGIKPPADIPGRKFIEPKKNLLEEIAADEAESREAVG